MQKLRQRGIWPYLGVLAGLFILSITAPRAWEKVVHRAPVVVDRAGRVRAQDQAKPAEFAREEKVRQLPQFVKPAPVDRAETPVPHATAANDGPPIAAPVARLADPDLLEGVAELAARPRRNELQPDMAPVGPSPELSLPVAQPQAPATDTVAEETPESALPQPSLSISIESTAPSFAAPNSNAPATEAPAFAAPQPSLMATREPPQQSTSRDERPRAIVIPAPTSAGGRAGAPQPPPSLYANVPAPNSAPAPVAKSEPQPGAIDNELLPVALIQRLEEAAVSAQCEPWARGVGRRVRELTSEAQPGSPQAKQLLAELRQATTAADQIVATLHDEPTVADLRRAQFALARRLDVWEQVFGTSAVSHETAQRPNSAEGELASLSGVEVLATRAAEGKQWRDYLMLDALRDASRGNDSDRRALARRVLTRLDKAKAQAQQRQFIDDAVVAELDKELRRWATEPADATRLLARLEKYEQTGAASDARLVADARRLMSYSMESDTQQLAQKIDENYRNANLRVVIAGDLINRLVPEQKSRQEMVDDRILGTPVEGTSTTSTRLFVRLVPDPKALRIGIEANGVVLSETSSNAGPATFYNQGQSDFLVRKLVLVCPTGMYVWPAVADANNVTDLQSMDTNYDGVPIVRSLARNIARSQYDQKKDEARHEVEAKVAGRAKAQLDAEADPRLSKVEAEFKKRFVAPVNKLALDPTVVSLATSDKRIMARVRFAGGDQLAANTPRPQAPSDSLASMQVHQSALNNVIERLELDGKTLTLPELYKWIADKFGRPVPQLPEDLPEDVTITFAPRDAVSVVCREGQVELTIGVAELVHENSKFRNFQVRAIYRPASERLQLGLKREGSISLSGERLNMKAQVVLRGIFGAALPAGKPVSLVPDEMLADPRLDDLSVTQFVVEDGWIGMAIGPRRLAGKPVAQPR